jgi:hypothetical protein
VRGLFLDQTQFVEGISMTMHQGPKPVSPDTKAMEAPREPRRQPGRGGSPTFKAKSGNPLENPLTDPKEDPAGLDHGASRLKHLNEHRKKD